MTTERSRQGIQLECIDRKMSLEAVPRYNSDTNNQLNPVIRMQQVKYVHHVVAYSVLQRKASKLKRDIISASRITHPVPPWLLCLWISTLRPKLYKYYTYSVLWSAAQQSYAEKRKFDTKPAGWICTASAWNRAGCQHCSLQLKRLPDPITHLDLNLGLFH